MLSDEIQAIYLVVTTKQKKRGFHCEDNGKPFLLIQVRSPQ
jgi:hypothetical protein